MYIYIRAMSESQKTIYSDIKSKVMQIDMHIIRLCLYPHVQEVAHWKKEVANFLMSIDSLKGRNKLPKKSFILKALSSMNERVDIFHLQVIDIESEYTPLDVSNHDLLQAMNSYHDWLATQLSTKGGIIPSEAYTVLSEITHCD